MFNYVRLIIENIVSFIHPNTADAHVFPDRLMNTRVGLQPMSASHALFLCRATRRRLHNGVNVSVTHLPQIVVILQPCL